ncbi:MAG: SLC13 family permease [Bacteroidota bacterium]|nr:SLC13 family permease [Bacteroidota bacterium]
MFQSKKDFFSKKSIGLLFGPLLFLTIILLPPPEGMSIEARNVLACTVWVAIWWITEAAPIPVTSLLPIVVFPLTGALSLKSTTEAYGNPIVFLYLGGFVIAIAMEKWNLHKRIALNIVKAIGVNQKKIVLGFMVATAFLSMWISNSATAMMMLPIGVAIIMQISLAPEKEGAQFKNNFGVALMLSIAYSASIGGLATLVGTPTNAVLAAIVKQLYNFEISFAIWAVFAFPLVIFLLIVCWYYLVYIAFPLQDQDNQFGQEEISRQAEALPKISWEEKWVMAVFSFTAFLWVTRSFLLDQILLGLDDSIIAITGAITLFLIPTKSGTGFILTWEASRSLPWGLLLLFGGGLAIASAFKDSGLATWIGAQMNLIQGMELFLLLLILVTAINFLTEITSNVATATMMLPILASIATAICIHPFGPMVAACMAASCAFMLPVATPPNAVVFGSGYIKMGDMVKAGFWLNIISIAAITFYVYYILPLVWGIDLFSLPDFIQK